MVRSFPPCNGCLCCFPIYRFKCAKSTVFFDKTVYFPTAFFVRFSVKKRRECKCTPSCGLYSLCFRLFRVLHRSVRRGRFRQRQRLDLLRARLFPAATQQQRHNAKSQRCTHEIDRERQHWDALKNRPDGNANGQLRREARLALAKIAPEELAEEEALRCRPSAARTPAASRRA